MTVLTVPGCISHSRYVSWSFVTFKPEISFSSMLIHLFLSGFFFLIYLFLAALGLHCCAWAFSRCCERGLLFVAVRDCNVSLLWLLLLWSMGSRCVASVVVAHGLSSCGSRALERRLSSCGARAKLFRGMWDLPGPGIEPVSPALAGGFLTTVPPGKSQKR